MIRRERINGLPGQYRQGDVLLIESKKPKLALKQEKQNRLVLEYGEVTGHAHALYETEKVDLYLEGTRRFLEVCYTLPLKHEEHEEIILEPKVYEVRRQHTYSVLEQMAKQVSD